MLRFQIIGETPGKKNSKIWTRSGKLIPSKAHQRWHTDAMLQLTGQISRLPREEFPYGPGRPDGIEDPVHVTLTFYHGDQVRRDSDNQAASIMDLLQDAKVLADDRWQIVRILSIFNHYDKGNARCLIEINRL
ncbi:MAG: RusA family crossover junction endodeoxyribonuclease [Spirochaetaceae bacterium]|nr:RusA family crossover junction endodeoxyribonuclease [Spirochaetaceae bacterium]